MEPSCLYVAINVVIEVIPCLDLAVFTQVYVNICVYSNYELSETTSTFI